MHALVEKMFRKYQQILATAMDFISRKRTISKTGEFVLKKNSATTVFLYCDINQFKALKVSGLFIGQERFLIFSFSIH